MNSIQIGHIIRSTRKQTGLSQEKLAELAGVGKTVIFDMEKGKPTVQLDTLLKIIDALNIKLTLETPLGEVDQ